MTEQLATQAPGDTHPTNKLSAGTTAAGLIGAVAIALSTLLGPALEELLPAGLGPNTRMLIVGVVMAVVGYIAIKFPSQAAAYNVLDKVNVPVNQIDRGVNMRSSYWIGSALVGVMALAACNSTGRIWTPSDIGGDQSIRAKLNVFCAADFVDSNVSALREWVAIYNLIATLPQIDREPIVGDFTANETVQALLAVRSGLCIATEPAPSVMNSI